MLIYCGLKETCKQRTVSTTNFAHHELLLLQNTHLQEESAERLPSSVRLGSGKKGYLPAVPPYLLLVHGVGGLPWAQASRNKHTYGWVA